MQHFLEGHTVQRFDAELRRIHGAVVSLGERVLAQVRAALQALEEQDPGAAQRVLEGDPQVDALALATREAVVDLIARRAPVARDLRVLMAMVRAVVDLERMGDEASRIASLGLGLYAHERGGPHPPLARDIHVMGRLVEDLSRRALEALDGLEVQSAEALVADHRELDPEFRSGMRRLTTFLLEDARTLGQVIQVVLVLKSLERIGDHARYLAGYVLYLVHGEVPPDPGSTRGSGKANG